MRRKCVVVDANVREVNGFPVYDLTLVNSHEMNEKHLRLGYTAERFNPNGPETIKYVSVVDKPDANGDSQAKTLFENAGLIDNVESLREATRFYLESSNGERTNFPNLLYKGLEIELGWRKSRDSDERVIPTFSAYTREEDDSTGKTKVVYCNNRITPDNPLFGNDFYNTGGENIGFNPNVLGNAWVDIENTVKPYDFNKREFITAWVQHQFSELPLEVKSWEIREFEEVEGVTEYSLWVNDEYMCDVGDVQEGKNSGLTFRDNGFENYLNGHFAYFEDGKMYYGEFLDDLKAFHELDDVRSFALSNGRFEEITGKILENRPLEVNGYNFVLLDNDASDKYRYGFVVNDKIVADFESDTVIEDRTNRLSYEETDGFLDVKKGQGFFIEGGLLYDVSTSEKLYRVNDMGMFCDDFLNDCLVTNKQFNDMVACYEQPELSLDKTNDINNPLYDRRNLSFSEVVDLKSKHGVLDLHRYADADFGF